MDPTKTAPKSTVWRRSPTRDRAVATVGEHELAVSLAGRAASGLRRYNVHLGFHLLATVEAASLDEACVGVPALADAWALSVSAAIRKAFGGEGGAA